MAFKPVVKVRKQKQQANSKSNAGKTSEHRTLNSFAAENDELTSDERRKIIAMQRQIILNTILVALDAEAAAQDMVRGTVSVILGAAVNSFARDFLRIIKPLNLGLIHAWADKEKDFQSTCNTYAAEIENGQVTITRENSLNGALQYADETINFAYVSTEDSSDDVKSILHALFPKIVNKGFIALDNYGGMDDENVQKSIHKFIGEKPTEIRIFTVVGTQIVLQKLGQN